ncbi:DUF4270 domain-containing protein [Flavobacterium sp.]|uniref:DUF4270 domain-containing protein n=1 Tax=Flavobacterium sp. TaxID=239 RepID=UPI003753DC0D
MKFNSFFKASVLVVTGFLLISCDKDFNEVGTNIIGEDHYDFKIDSTKSVVAYNQALGAVQSNNLPTNALGYYNHPLFGKTKASFVTQIELIAANPTFIKPAEVVIDSVYLYIPYFSKYKSTTTAGDKIYELDSIYGNNTIKLDVFESGYYLRDFDASTGLEEVQKYYSNQKQLFDDNKGNGGLRLNDASDEKQNDKFEFKTTEIKLQYLDEDAQTVVKERLAPGMFLELNEFFFTNKIVNAPAGKLLNNNAFRDYFRGLYFEVNNSSTSVDQGSLALLNFKNGKIVMVYQDETSATNTERIRKSIEFKLNGNSVNLFEPENTATSTNYTTALSNNTPDTATGDEKLYLKGQNGSMAVIELFGEDGSDENLIPDELDAIIDDGWLINEASLTFYIEKNAMFTSNEPYRIYLYDMENNVPILDYTTDRSTNAADHKLDKVIHGGLLEKEDIDNGRGTQYKIRLTNYLRSLIADENRRDNVKLGLVVTESITATTNAKLANPITTYNDIDLTPIASVMNPLGTVLYGSSSTIPDGKRLKLKIYYTKPD